jgi:hypothetical protein
MQGIVTIDDYYRYAVDPGAIPEPVLIPTLQAALTDADTVCFCRVVSRWDRMSNRQKDLVKQAIVAQACFRHAYAAELESPLSSYSINGVSMSFDKSKIVSRAGVQAPARVYAMLQESGLTYLGVA